RLEGVHVRTASDGRFTWTGRLAADAPVPPASDHVVGIRIEAALDGHSRGEFDLLAGFGSTVFLGDLVLEPGGTVAGTVRDPLGTPGRGVVVLAIDLNDPGAVASALRRQPRTHRPAYVARAETGADGTFEIGELPAGWIQLCAQQDAGLYRDTDPIEVRAGET